MVATSLASNIRKPSMPRSMRATGWDPSCPYRLFVLPTEESSSENEFLTPFYSHDGVGCNAYERSALLELLDGSLDDDGEDQNHEWSNTKQKKFHVKFQSQTYRRALQKCLMAWQDHMQENDDTTAAPDAANLELLKIVYGVTHLTEIFMFSGNSNEPGAVTADTVRFLRHHHMDSIDIPEDTTGTSSEYWSTLQSLVLRGCLEDAWALLSHHILCRRCFETTQESQILDEYDRVTLQEDRDGFVVLRALLLSAPLPGGRHDSKDEGFTLLKQVEDDEENDENVDPVFLEGIPSDTYELWETSSNTTPSSSRMSDRPLEYNAYAATSTYQAWRRLVNEYTSSTLAPLVRRLPQLQSSVLNILSGQFEDNVVLGHWSDAFCAELLYQRPQLCPRDISTRLKRVMEKFGATGAFEKILLSVMHGNAGRVVSVLHDLGGGSGAALPATMTTLLCNLLTLAGELPKNDPPAFSIQTELLLSASESILSSLSKELDLAVRLSSKLLLPHATPENDVRITATLAETLSRHASKTDAEARTLVSLCRPMVARKSRRVLDGCVDLALTRYSDRLPSGRSVHWLLRGLDLELLLFCENRDEGAWETVLASGRCGAILRKECITTAHSLLAGLRSETVESSVGEHYLKAGDMVSSIRNDDDLSDFCQKIPDVELLFHIESIAKAIAANESDRVIADHVVMCLEDKTCPASGVVSYLAHPSLLWDLLLLACDVLKRDEELGERSRLSDCNVASFDVRGMQFLMERFAQVKLTQDDAATDTQSVDPMRLAMGKGLMRAFVAENSKKKDTGFRFHKQSRAGSVLSFQLSSRNRREQESIVRAMLDPSM